MTKAAVVILLPAQPQRTNVCCHLDKYYENKPTASFIIFFNSKHRLLSRQETATRFKYSI